MRSTRAGVGITTGSPSVQPSRCSCSRAAASSAACSTLMRRPRPTGSLSASGLAAQDGDDPRRQRVGQPRHRLGAAAGHRVGQAQPGHVGHAVGQGDQIALRPEVIGHQGHHGAVPAGQLDPVTHGAGGAAASMAVGGDDGRALGLDLAEVLLAGQGAGVALVPQLDVDARDGSLSARRRCARGRRPSRGSRWRRGRPSRRRPAPPARGTARSAHRRAPRIEELHRPIIVAGRDGGRVRIAGDGCLLSARMPSRFDTDTAVVPARRRRLRRPHRRRVVDRAGTERRLHRRPPDAGVHRRGRAIADRATPAR